MHPIQIEIDGSRIRVRPQLDKEQLLIVHDAKLNGLETISDSADDDGRFTAYDYKRVDQERLTRESLKVAAAFSCAGAKVVMCKGLEKERYRPDLGASPQRFGGLALGRRLSSVLPFHL